MLGSIRAILELDLSIGFCSNLSVNSCENFEYFYQLQDGYHNNLYSTHTQGVYNCGCGHGGFDKHDQDDISKDSHGHK